LTCCCNPLRGPSGGSSPPPFQASVTTVGNTCPTGADFNFHAIATADFAVSAASPAFSFDPAGCVATCITAGRYVVRVLAALGQGGDITTFAQWSGCVDKSGDVVGTAALSQLGNGEQFVLNLAAPLNNFSFSGAFERVVDLVAGDTVQPAFAADNFPGGDDLDLAVFTLTMTIEA
jgi:hypothetical protein